MRTLLLAAAIASVSSLAIAQRAADRPETPAPLATASFESREDWCQKYAAWFVEHTPARGAAPSDVSPTHRLEVEFNSCKLDPQAYEHDTQAELAQAAETEATAPG